jgi:hypothetical protein
MALNGWPLRRPPCDATTSYAPSFWSETALGMVKSLILLDIKHFLGNLAQ